MWSSQLRYFLKCSLNLLLREQPLLPVLDVFGADWVRLYFKRSSVPAAEDNRRSCVLQLNIEGFTANKITISSS